jgi:hypothetical protein
MSRGVCLVIVFLAAASHCAFAQNQVLSSGTREQLEQDVRQLQANPSDDALRTRIIQQALTLQPQPATPPDADELVGRAKYIFEHANSNGDLLKAADAFEKVSLLVPWVPDYYFDAAVAYEKANDPANALENYKWSLLAYPPDSQDAKSVREKIGALSYVLEQQQAAAAAAHAQRAAAARAEQTRRDAEAQAEREQEQAAEQAREQQERQEQQRLARLDPLVQSLNGAVYIQDGHDSMGNRMVRTWTISGDRIKEHRAFDTEPPSDDEYAIEGKSFVRMTTSPCVKTPECQLVGTISEKEIGWSWWYKGSFLNKYQDPWGGNARRVKP